MTHSSSHSHASTVLADFSMQLASYRNHIPFSSFGLWADFQEWARTTSRNLKYTHFVSVLLTLPW